MYLVEVEKGFAGDGGRQVEVGADRGTDRLLTMDPKIVREGLDLKLHNRYPEGSTSKEELKRRADTSSINTHSGSIVELRGV